MSRAGALYIQNAAYPTPTETSNYQYSGVGRVMETRHESLISEVALTRYIPATPGDYVNLDRFGRVKSQIWKTSSSLRDQQDYDHDLAGNRIQRDLPATLSTTHDQLYTYDGLNRLADYKQGTIAAGAIASPTKDATWELDGLGNWANYAEKASGTTTLDQDRTHNTVNEITDFTNTTGSSWTDPTHDAAGNLTLAPSPVAPTNSAKDQTYIWDAWNRLVEVKEGGTTLAKFGYDGLNRRITKLVGSDTYHYYLSEQNQVLEEQKQVGAGTPTLYNNYVWHPHYVDALALRYDVSGVSPVAYYALHDANYNITAMVDGNGAVVERYQYTPYGQVICTNPSFGSPTATSTIGQRNLYTGRELDLETGLYYYRARYYHNALGRFIGRDPIEEGENLYRYERSRPLNLLDPTGLTDCDQSTEGTYVGSVSSTKLSPGGQDPDKSKAEFNFMILTTLIADAPTSLGARDNIGTLITQLPGWPTPTGRDVVVELANLKANFLPLVRLHGGKVSVWSKVQCKKCVANNWFQCIRGKTSWGWEDVGNEKWVSCDLSKTAWGMKEKNDATSITLIESDTLLMFEMIRFEDIPVIKEECAEQAGKACP